jgi:hypothetical protein
MTDRKNVFAIGVFVAVLFGGFLAIHGSHQKMAREQEAIRVKTEQRRLAQEAESKRLEMEAAQEQERLAQEQEQEQNRLAQAKEQEQRRLAQEQEQKRLAEMEQERILSQIPVVLSSNNVVLLSVGEGELFDVTSEGVLFCENRRDPRTPWSVLTEADAKAVLRTPMGFAAVTAFAAKTKIPTDFYVSDLEQQMRQIWRQGNTLKERMITRMEILGIFEKYYKARARYFGDIDRRLADDAEARKAKDQADQAVAHRGTGMSAGQFFAMTPSARQYYLNERAGGGPNILGSSSDLLEQMAVHQMVSASASADASAASADNSKADRYSKLSVAAAADEAIAEGELYGYVAQLAELGFKLPHDRGFLNIPPMNLRREIVVELNSNPMPSALTNTPPTNDAKRPSN